MISKGQYKHYQGVDYRVIGIAIDAGNPSSDEKCVLYTRVNKAAHEEDLYYFLKEEQFAEEVGIKVPRFQQVEGG